MAVSRDTVHVIDPKKNVSLVTVYCKATTLSSPCKVQNKALSCLAYRRAILRLYAISKNNSAIIVMGKIIIKNIYSWPYIRVFVVKMLLVVKLS